MKLGIWTSAAAGEAAAIRRAQAVIEFDLTGKIVEANENFLNVVGYDRSEIVGQNHKLFVEQGYASSREYQEFWDKLRQGQAIETQFLRIGKNGKQIWLQATYTPILDRAGRPSKVIKFATDITAAKQGIAHSEGQVAAIHKSQAVIEFDLNGNILDANDNFLNALGYRLEEIRGQHHSMFVDPTERQSEAYARFWQKLGRGEYDDGQYMRVAKGGRTIWIQASYNPILDALGKPYRVIKYATDITANKLAEFALRKAVEETQDVIRAAKAKNLTKRIDPAGKTSEIAELCNGVNEILDTLTDMVLSVSSISEQINTGSLRMGKNSRELAQRTEEQAASLEETAATTEELAASVKRSSERAHDATALGAYAKEAADRGGRIVGEAVVAMESVRRQMI